MSSIQRLVRFRSTCGRILYGEAGLKAGSEDALIGRTVGVYEGSFPWDPNFGLTDQMATIDEHVAEAGFPVTPYPVIFTKPPDALAGPFQDIPVHPDCTFLDYEADLCFVIGRDCKNVHKDEDAMQYVLGYTVGNDVSSRYWQAQERSGGQHGSAKSFDKFALLGPVITSRSAVQDPHNLSIESFVNGEVRQSASTNDLIYDIPFIIQHISRGTTLRKGTVIMTGTPSGVAALMKPPAWLQDGDIVEVEIEGIGRIRNKMTFTM